MNHAFRHIITAICGLLVASGITAAYFAGVEARRPLKCEGIRVVIKDSLTNSFVSAGDIKTCLEKSYGNYMGMPLDSMDLTRMEKAVESRSAVKNCEAFVTRDGYLNISVMQRRPVVRFQKTDGGFYADCEGCLFPLQNSFASHVQVVDGNIPLKANTGHKGYIEDAKEKEWFEGIMEIINFLNESRIWKGKIVQIHLDDKSNLIMIPREGNERFIFGRPENTEEKFAKMEKYYSTIVPEKGSGYYRWIDLRFGNQIVCRQK